LFHSSHDPSNNFTGRARREQHRRGLLANVAVGDNRVTRLNSRLGEDVPKIGRRFQLAGFIVERVERNVLRARDVAESAL
jgi:hypothetical protein